ncbi:rhamnan synthesis F family protein, partial [Rhodanobacter sp. OR444]
RTALQPVPTADARPCAVIHLWYPELLDELAAALHASGIDWRIVITTGHEREQAVRERVAQLGLAAEIEVFENRGRDILPFLHVANRLLDEGVTTVLKLHGKRSTHRQDGETWRRELLDKLLAPERAARIAAAMREDATLGLVHAEGHLQPLDYYWGANQANVDYLTRRLGIPAPDVERDSFTAGSMLWLRPAALRPLLDAHLGVEEFEPEAGQLDGTLAHAVERVLTLAADAGGFHTADAATLLGLAETRPQPYSYARRSG